MEVTKCIVGDEVEQAIDAMMATRGPRPSLWSHVRDCWQINERHVPFSMHR